MGATRLRLSEVSKGRKIPLTAKNVILIKKNAYEMPMHLLEQDVENNCFRAEDQSIFHHNQPKTMLIYSKLTILNLITDKRQLSSALIVLDA